MVDTYILERILSLSILFDISGRCAPRGGDCRPFADGWLLIIFASIAIARRYFMNTSGLIPRKRVLFFAKVVGSQLVSPSTICYSYMPDRAAMVCLRSLNRCDGIDWKYLCYQLQLTHSHFSIFLCSNGYSYHYYGCTQFSYHCYFTSLIFYYSWSLLYYLTLL